MHKPCHIKYPQGNQECGLHWAHFLRLDCGWRCRWKSKYNEQLFMVLIKDHRNTGKSEKQQNVASDLLLLLSLGCYFCSWKLQVTVPRVMSALISNNHGLSDSDSVPVHFRCYHVSLPIVLSIGHVILIFCVRKSSFVRLSNLLRELSVSTD